jgi:hypothetical protein
MQHRNRKQKQKDSTKPSGHNDPSKSTHVIKQHHASPGSQHHEYSQGLAMFRTVLLLVMALELIKMGLAIGPMVAAPTVHFPLFQTQAIRRIASAVSQLLSSELVAASSEGEQGRPAIRAAVVVWWMVLSVAALLAVQALTCWRLQRSRATRVLAVLEVVALVLYVAINLLETAFYNNHHYLYALLLLLFVLFPPSTVYQRTLLYLLRFTVCAERNCVLVQRLTSDAAAAAAHQICIMYFYAGVAKLNCDWLIHAQPIHLWYCDTVQLRGCLYCLLIVDRQVLCRISCMEAFHPTAQYLGVLCAVLAACRLGIVGHMDPSISRSIGQYLVCCQVGAHNCVTSMCVAEANIAFIQSCTGVACV